MKWCKIDGFGSKGKEKVGVMGGFGGGAVSAMNFISII